MRGVFQQPASADWYSSKYFKAFDLEEGTNQTNVAILNIAAPEWIPAFNRGDIVGFFGWEPWLNKALEIVDGAHILHRGSDNNLHVLNNCMVFSSEWVQRDPATARKVMAALVDAHEGVSQNLKQAVQLSSTPMRIPENVLMGMADGFIYKVEFTTQFLAHMSDAAKWLESKAPLKPGQGRQIISDLVHPDLLRSVAPHRVDVGN